MESLSQTPIGNPGKDIIVFASMVNGSSFPMRLS